jgi:integrase
METCVWCNTSKTFVELKKFPKNREPRPFYITDPLMEILERRLAFKTASSDYVFHIEGEPLNYCTIQVNFRQAQRVSGIPYRGTHILRHGMAALARKVWGGLDGAIAVTGHRDVKLADHYSKLDGGFQKEVALKVDEYMRLNPLEEKVLEFRREATAP